MKTNNNTHQGTVMMNHHPAQHIPNNSQQYDADPIPIDTAQLRNIAELLNILDGFLRHADGIVDRLTDYLHATGRDHPRLPDGTSYNANLLIDQVSFTAHSLRAHRREPLQ